MNPSFSLDKALLEMLDRVGADVGSALAASGIPYGTSGIIQVSEAQFFLFMENIINCLPSDDAVMRIINAESLPSFSPPSFAAMCSYNGEQFIDRLIRYKKLVCPLVLTKEKSRQTIRVSIATGSELRLPPFMAELETLFIIHLIRKGTGKHIKPLEVELPHSDYSLPTRAFYDCPIVHSDVAAIDFSQTDMELPFVTHNETMWEIMHPGLENQLMTISQKPSFLYEVRQTIIRLMPGGDCTLAETASRLCISPRTLQRRLAEEDKTFYGILADIRKQQATAYLKNPDLSLHNIAYLLGFKETNSFLRLFRNLEGKTAATFRKESLRLYN